MLRALILRASAAICLMVVLFPASRAEGNLNSFSGPMDSRAMEGAEPVYSATDGVLHFELDNGITARVFTREYLEMRTSQTSSGWGIELEDGRYLSVITDINDPAIVNKGDGSFHPFGVDQVIEVLSEISYPGLKLPLTVYILPYPREDVLVSSTRGNEIFLSPHVMEISMASAAYIVTHEAGHVFQHRFLPAGSSGKWEEYRRVRGMEDSNTFNSSASHPYKPEEIFAEDFRVLFGGRDAVLGGNIENPELPSPYSVDGLRDFFVALGNHVPVTSIVLFGNYPNPFNPQTEISITLSDEFLRSGKRMSLKIYDVTGRLVREIYEGIPERSSLIFHWDGTDERGRRVASAVYLCVAKAGDSRRVRKMLMIK